MELEIKRIEKQRMHSIVPLLSRLNPLVPLGVLEDRLREMVQQDYQCIGVYDKTELIGISGIWIMTKYYVGKHIEPDNVYILPEYQGRGIGKRLMDWIFEYAKSVGCVASELNCYIDNDAGQRFWTDQGYKLVAYHYQKKL